MAEGSRKMIDGRVLRLIVDGVVEKINREHRQEIASLRAKLAEAEANAKHWQSIARAAWAGRNGPTSTLPSG
jgi:hypothetical protein